MDCVGGVCGAGVELFGVKLGHTGALGSTAAPFNVQNPSLKLAQSS